MSSYTQPFLPRADAAFRTMASNFARGISRNPARYMMSPAEAASIMDAFVCFDSAYFLAVNPATRTRGAIVAKDDARSILRDRIRSYAAFIPPNLGITDDDKISIGVPQRNIARGKRSAPGTPPLLSYIGSRPGMDEFVYHDSDRCGSKAKPYGAERLELWRAYTHPGHPRAKVSEAHLIGSFKKSKVIVDQDRERDSRQEGDGKPTYWARWAGFDGSVGPWSLPVSLSSAKKPVAVAGDSSETEMRKAA